MISVADYFAAMLMGLAGAGHCLMMCGGLAGALGPKPGTTELLTYNLGRISSYMMAGALVGLFSQLALASFMPALLGLRFLAALFLIALGLYFAGWWFGLQRLERIGRPLWRRLAPRATKVQQSQTLRGRFAAGFIWCWLPCGLVYSALSWAALSGTAVQGALYMLLFGLGTLPAMFAFGWFTGAVQSILKAQGFRQAMGVLLIVYGIWTLIIALRQVIALG